MFNKKKPDKDTPNTGPLSFPANYKFPDTADLPKIDTLVLEEFFQDLETYRKANACE